MDWKNKVKDNKGEKPNMGGLDIMISPQAHGDIVAFQG